LVMRRSDLAIPPRAGEAPEKGVKIRIAVWENVNRLTRRQTGEVMLHRANLVEES